MSNIFNPNPQEIKDEADHIAALAEDIKRNAALAQAIDAAFDQDDADAAADIDKEYTKQLARIEAE